MAPPSPHPDRLEAQPKLSSSKRPRSEDDDATSMMRAGAKISQYSHVSASDQARQHIGDVFHGPVTLQHVATTPAAATAPAGRGGLMKSLEFKEMDARLVGVHSHLVGTCEWLSEAPEYKEWMDPELMSTHHGFLWIKGKAGAGKSTLMKHASSHAEAHCVAKQHVLVFFFHARGGSIETSTDGLFRTLLHQILVKVPAVYDSLDKRRLGLVKRQGWSSPLLQDTFREAVLSLDQDQVSCYIDAMDECRHEDVENIIRYFDNLADALVSKGKQFHVCLSSRHYPNLQSSRSIELVLEDQQGHDKDIWEYIQRRLMIDSKALKHNLAKTIRSKAYGVFLWVVLVVALVNQDDRYGEMRGIYERLSQIPEELSDLFNELIGRGTCSKYFRPLLRWVAFSRRPLMPEELYCIMMHTSSNTGFNNLAFKRKSLTRFILHASKGLVEAPHLDSVQFIHESLRTYFLGAGVVHLIDQAFLDRVSADSIKIGAQESAIMTACCHDHLKESCLGYLLHITSMPSPSASEQLVEFLMRRHKLLTSYPFFHYAVSFIMWHSDTALDLGLTQQAFMDVLPWNKLNTLHDIQNGNHRGWRELVSIEPWYKAYIAAKFGYPKLLKAVLDSHSPIEANRTQWGAILCASVDASDDEGVSIALRAGADPNAPSPARRGQCLQYAVYHATKRPAHYWDDPTNEPRRWHIVELLLKHGARPYATSEGAGDCLHEASLDNDLKVIRILLGEHLKADAQCSHYGVSLARTVGKASFHGNNEMLQFLMDKGSESRFWSRARYRNDHVAGASLEVTFGDEPTVQIVLAQVPRVLPSSESSMDLTLRFILQPERWKQISVPQAGSQS